MFYAAANPVPEVVNNVFTRCGVGIRIPNGANGNEIRFNDIFSDAQNPIWIWNGQNLDPVNVGEGNIREEPQFVGNHDYHLTGDSPCLNTGSDDLIDIIDGSRSDMGAYGAHEGVAKVFSFVRPNEVHWWGSLPANQHPDVYLNYYYPMAGVKVLVGATAAQYDFTMGEGNVFRAAQGASIETANSLISFVGTAAAPVIFTSQDAQGWAGIKLGDAGANQRNVLTFCNISNAVNGVWTAGVYATLTTCNFTNCTAGVNCGWQNGNQYVVVNGCGFSNCDYGIQAFGNYVDADGCLIEDCETGLAAWWPGGGGQIASATDCEFDDCDLGIYVANANANITNCQVHDGIEGIRVFIPIGTTFLNGCEVNGNTSFGVRVENGPSSVSLNQCDVHHNNFGLWISGATVISTFNDYFSNLFEGVYMMNSMGWFKEDHIYDNDLALNAAAGMYCFNSDPFLKRLKITDNYGYGILSAGGSDPVLDQGAMGNTGYNRIRNNGLVAPLVRLARAEIWMDNMSMVELNFGRNDIYDDLNDVYVFRQAMPAAPIQAQMNYWGPLGPQAGNFSPQGLVNFMPWDANPNVLDDAEEWAAADTFLTLGVGALADSAWEDAANIFWDIVTDYPESRAAVYSLSRLRFCAQQIDGIDQNFSDALDGLPRRVRNEAYLTQLERTQNLVLQDLGDFEQATRRIRAQMRNAACREDSVVFAIDLELALIREEAGDGNHNDAAEEHGRERLARLGMMLEGKSWEETDPNYVPASIALLSSYPNPFNSSATISFTLGEAGAVQVAVYDLSGREVSTLFDSRLTEGRHEFHWNANGLAAGVYIARVTAANSSSDLKLLLIR
ncbi:MAG: T9SS type A sorting domain-containing protein [Calditrichaeota bacterium]|nr:T9SS type A sorting domain-containing protein [Calditrichota bacterium]